MLHVKRELLIRSIYESGFCIHPDSWKIFQHRVRGLVSMSCQLLLLEAESSTAVWECPWMAGCILRKPNC
jgi:hypothetical protein